MIPATDVSVHPAATGEPQWRRLSHRVIWVDLAIGLISLIPGLLGLWLAPSEGTLWFLGLVTLTGVAGAIGDALRWVSTAYRVTDTEVQRRSGIFIRRSRSVRRDRIRSVDTYARLRHRMTGMRVVTVGAGQQTNTREAAFKLDALTREGAERLRGEILGLTQENHPRATPSTLGTQPAPEEPATEEPATEEPATEEPATEPSVDAQGVEVLERFRIRWALYNIFTVWAYVMAAGIIWAGVWMLASFGVDVPNIVSGLIAGLDLNWVAGSVILLIGGGAFGAVLLGIMFIVSNWNFELARVHSATGSFLRTRRGLFSTREVNRDEARVRGVSIDEPLLWRWTGMADTNVLTTGLSLSSSEEATALVPRGPISVARRVAQYVVGEAYGTSATLPRHPRGALRRRLFWATCAAVGAVGAVAVPVWLGIVPLWVLWISLGVWPVAIAGACIAYVTLGHAIHGDYAITRSGLVHRSTAVLRRDAVSTIAVRQSLLQRRLGLSTVTLMTAAGWGAYEAVDLDTDEGFGFASDAAPGILDPFLELRRG